MLECEQTSEEEFGGRRDVVPEVNILDSQSIRKKLLGKKKANEVEYYVHLWEKENSEVFK